MGTRCQVPMSATGSIIQRLMAENCKLPLERAWPKRIERRLIARWHHHGLSDAEARRRAFDNDIPNARRVIDGSVAAEAVIRSVDLPWPK